MVAVSAAFRKSLPGSFRSLGLKLSFRQESTSRVMKIIPYHYATPLRTTGKQAMPSTRVIWLISAHGEAVLAKDIMADRPAYFQQAFGNPDTHFAVNRYAGFAQDHWRLNSRLTLDFGLRYDFEQLPSTFNEDTNNISPRIGVAFSPSESWVLRSGFGIFFDRYPLAHVIGAVEKHGTTAFD